MDIIQKSIATVVYLRPKDACGHEHDNKSNQKSCAYEPTNKSPPLRGIATSSADHKSGSLLIKSDPGVATTAHLFFALAHGARRGQATNVPAAACGSVTL